VQVAADKKLECCADCKQQLFRVCQQQTKLLSDDQSCNMPDGSTSHELTSKFEPWLRPSGLGASKKGKGGTPSTM
jgi:hypothetical protein